MRKKNRLRRKTGEQRSLGRNLLLLLLLILLGVGGWVATHLFEGGQPVISVADKPAFIGKHASLALTVADADSGLRLVRVTLVQAGREHELFRQAFPRQAWLSRAGVPEMRQDVVLDVAKAGVKDGKAELVISARDFSLLALFKGNLAQLRLPVVVDTQPPEVTLFFTPPAIRTGGSGIVVYSLSEPAVRHGVMLGQRFYPGFALPDGRRYVAYLGVPWDSQEIGRSRVVAFDSAGNQASKAFALRLRKVRYKQDRIRVSDAFLKRKIPEFQEHYPELKGSLLEKYLFVNTTIRRRNAETIAKICQHPQPKRLWQGRFLRMAGAGRAGFGDQRTYFYHDKPVDHQTHLGMDIASTARVAIKAANRGKVIFADYLGIYGNTVILDHGQGVYSLYSHLSRFDTTPGTLVEKKQVIAHSGATGMAGGDHLHFSMLVHGVFVTPREWWDGHWLRVEILDIVGEATAAGIHGKKPAAPASPD